MKKQNPPEFMVGDYVRGYDDRSPGVVVAVYGDSALVQHDKKFPGGHNGNDTKFHCKPGHGWWYFFPDLDLIDRPTDAGYGDASDVDVEDLM